MRSLRETVPFVVLLFIVGIAATNGCSPVPSPTPALDIAATVDAAVAVALASQPAPDVAATVKAAVATEMAATQTAQAEPTATSTPVPLTATPGPTDTPTVSSTDTPTSIDTPTVTPTPTSTPTATPPPLPLEPDSMLDLMPTYGISNCCPIDGSQGTIGYFSSSVGALKGTIQLSGLEPGHSYVLTLNGWPGDSDINNALANCGSPGDCGFYGDEGFWNFMRVHADGNGNASDSLNVPLPPLEYNVKFFMKDPATRDWCVVLYNNSFEFSVQ